MVREKFESLELTFAAKVKKQQILPTETKNNKIYLFARDLTKFSSS